MPLALSQAADHQILWSYRRIILWLTPLELNETKLAGAINLLPKFLGATVAETPRISRALRDRFGADELGSVIVVQDEYQQALGRLDLSEINFNSVKRHDDTTEPTVKIVSDLVARRT